LPSRRARRWKIRPPVRQQVYEDGWVRGHHRIHTAVQGSAHRPAANDTAAEFVRGKIRSIVKDPAVAERLTPTDHFIGTKRICLDTDYFETYNRDNVTLVDVRSAPIEAITPRGIRTAEREYPLDAIVMATGFDAMTGALLAIDIRNGAGATLAQKWAAWSAHLPGPDDRRLPQPVRDRRPGQPIGADQHDQFDRTACGLDHPLHRAPARPRHHPHGGRSHGRRPVGRTRQQVADQTLLPRANSWYVGANVPGKPRVFMPYLGGLHVYRARCEEVAARDYEGFALSS
jgi:cyclohexanone monooxygenase